MQKVTAYTLAWSPTRQAYELYESRFRETLPVVPESSAWFTWLTQVSSFTFQGQTGCYTAHQEPKQRGGRYWYAYRATGEKRMKRYLGKTADLTLARLEQVASALSADRAAPLQTKRETPPKPSESEAHLPIVTVDAGAGSLDRRRRPRRAPDHPAPLTGSGSGSTHQ